MIVLAFDPGLSLGWATNSTSYHRGQRGAFAVDEASCKPRPASEQDLLATRLDVVDRFVTDQLIRTISPDVIVIERQPHMGRGGVGARSFQAHSQINRSIEAVLVMNAGRHGACFLWPWPQTWQAWAKRHQTIAFEEWQAAGKPDHISAHLMVQWALAEHRIEAA